MQSFSFKANFNENRNIERIITARNRKLAKQQIVFALILFVLVALLAWYLVRKVIYTEFDGYVQTQYMDYRAMEDIYLFRQYKDVGDIVFPGDTIYSYTFINLFGIDHLNSEPGVVTYDRNLRVQLSVAQSEINVLQVQIEELEKQIAKEDNNIRFGLTDNSHKMDLQRELAEAREKLNAARRKVSMYNNIHRESLTAVNRYGQYSIGFANEQWDIDYSLRQLYDRNSSTIRYAIVQDTAVVTKLWAAPFSRVFKKEQIIQLEALNLRRSNMQVVAYVPTGDMGKINNHTHAEVIVNDEVSFGATVQLLGARTEDLPEELRNSLSHNYTDVMVVFAPDQDKPLPLWAVVDHVPVKVRIKNFDNGRRDDGSDYWYLDWNGLTCETRKHLGILPPDADCGTIANRAAATAPAAEPTHEAAPQPKPTAAEAESFIRYKIKKGDTLFGIAKKHDTTVARIVELNPGLNTQKLYVGKELRIPAQSGQ